MALKPCSKLGIAILGGEFCTINLGSCSGKLLVLPTYATFGVASFLNDELPPLAPYSFFLKNLKILFPHC
jgi:hypothetical protein